MSSCIQGWSVKIAALINDLWGFVVLKVEILEFRSQVKGISLFRYLGQDAFEDMPRISFIWSSIGLQNVTEHPGNRSIFRPPREKLEGGGIGLGDHVALLDPGKPFNS